MNASSMYLWIEFRISIQFLLEHVQNVYWTQYRWLCIRDRSGIVLRICTDATTIFSSLIYSKKNFHRMGVEEVRDSVKASDDFFALTWQEVSVPSEHISAPQGNDRLALSRFNTGYHHCFSWLLEFVSWPEMFSLFSKTVFHLLPAAHYHDAWPISVL